MNFQVVTLFPEMIQEAVKNSVIGRAIRNGIISVDTVCIRDFSNNKHGRVDDYPYGGGAGMVMEAEPVYQAVCHAVNRSSGRCTTEEKRRPRVIYLTPQAEVLTQTKVESLALEEELILLCGHYEGIDERVLEEVVTDYISIGDYVLTGGELGALVLIDAVSRFVPGVLGNDTSADFESMQDNLLEYPHYTRPEIWHDKKVPAVLLSGDHKKVERWRYGEAIRRTGERRPDLLARARRIICVWYGADSVGTFAEALLARVSRYGELLNYNRNTLRRKKRELSQNDLLLLVTDDAACRSVPEKIYGMNTEMIMVITDPVPSETGEKASCHGSEEIFEQQNGFWESRGFCPAGKYDAEASSDDACLTQLALSIRANL